MKKFIRSVLTNLVRGILERHSPEIIGITGNVGKTTTRAVLEEYLTRTEQNVRASRENYNTDWGVIFTIIGVEPPGRNPFRWGSVIFKAFQIRYLTSEYPDVLVLEVGIDAPGDMDAFVDLLYLDVVILTNIGTHPVHKEFFTDAKAVAKEKLKLVDALTPDGTLIYNADEPHFAHLKRRRNSTGTILTFGTGEEADFRAGSVSQSLAWESEREEVHGSALVPYLSFTVKHRRASLPMDVPYLFVESQVYVVLPTIAYAVTKGANMVNINDALSVPPTPGRLRFLEGVSGSVLIDDTYNAAPAAMKQALNVFTALDTSDARCIAILGDMKELGEDEVEIHTSLVETVKANADVFVGVGDLMHSLYAELAEEPLMETHWFATSEEAAEWAGSQITGDDIILVKGSQSMRMERVVKAVMKHPDRAKDLLVRQSGKWA